MAAPHWRGHVIVVGGEVFKCESEDYGEWYKVLGKATRRPDGERASGDSRRYVDARAGQVERVRV